MGHLGSAPARKSACQLRWWTSSIRSAPATPSAPACLPGSTTTTALIGISVSTARSSVPRYSSPAWSPPPPPRAPAPTRRVASSSTTHTTDASQAEKNCNRQDGSQRNEVSIVSEEKGNQGEELHLLDDRREDPSAMTAPGQQQKLEHECGNHYEDIEPDQAG